MAFYYTSLFSIVPLGIAYGLLALLYWGVMRATRGARARAAILSVVGVVFLVLPVAEELWIAWSFGQACKEAGTFVHKQVQVDGFYDDTRDTHPGPPTPQAVEALEKSRYRFLEMKGAGRVVRTEKIDGTGRRTVIDRPTARYHYKMPSSHEPVGHKITKHEAIVIDSAENEIDGRYTRFSRAAPWFYFAIPGDFACDAPGRWPRTSGTFAIYRTVLKPASER